MASTLQEIVAKANCLVDDLTALAELVDPVYSGHCRESGLTNRPPRTEAERLVSLLHGVALTLNASLADSDFIPDEDHPPYGYLAEHGWRAPDLTGLPQDWQSRLSSRELVRRLTADFYSEDALTPADRELILEEFDVRDARDCGEEEDY